MLQLPLTRIVVMAVPLLAVMVVPEQVIVSRGLRAGELVSSLLVVVAGVVSAMIYAGAVRLLECRRLIKLDVHGALYEGSPGLQRSVDARSDGSLADVASRRFATGSGA